MSLLKKIPRIAKTFCSTVGAGACVAGLLEVFGDYIPPMNRGIV